MFGFSLARTLMFNPANVEHATVPGKENMIPALRALSFANPDNSLSLGEWFWYRQKLYKPSIFIHIYLSISKLQTYRDTPVVATDIEPFPYQSQA